MILREFGIEAVHKLAQDVAERLKMSSAKAWPERTSPDRLPSIAGKVDETGITPQMRELLKRQGARGLDQDRVGRR